MAHTKETKENVISLVKTRLYTLKEIEAETGVRKTTIIKWVRDVDDSLVKSKRCSFSQRERNAVIQDYLAGDKVYDICRKHDIVVSTFYNWRKEYVLDLIGDGMAIVEVAISMRLPLSKVRQWSQAFFKDTISFDDEQSS